MKREFIKTLLPDITDEALNASMAENGKDLEKHKTEAETEKATAQQLKTQLEEANKSIEGFKTLDIDGIKQAAEQWKTKAEQAER